MVNIDKFGRPRIWANGKRTTVSKVVWEAINGPILKGHVIHHIDHNPANNDISNLKLMTRLEHDKYHNTILLDIEKLKYEYASGKSMSEIGKLHNCSERTIHRAFKKNNIPTRSPTDRAIIQHKKSGHIMSVGV